MFDSCRFPAMAARLAIACTVTVVALHTLGCGKDVMVSSWELRLTAADAGTETIELPFPGNEVLPDGGQSQDREAIEASYEAHHDAKKKNENENKDRQSDTRSDGDSNHP